MADIMTPEARSVRMRLIRSQDTQPEMLVRRLIHRLGFRYRLHVKKLPGSPDIVFPSRRKIIFVNGCFWHMHSYCRDGKIPKSRRLYWEPKLQRTCERDSEHLRVLKTLGWKTLVIWECELKNMDAVQSTIQNFLE